jgi:hypothetical protein
MVAVLIHDDLKGIDFNDLHYLGLDDGLVVGILYDLLDDPASIAMQTNEQEFLLGNLVNKLALGLAADLNVLLHHIIPEFVIDEDVDMLVKILEDLILEVLVAGL